MLPLGEYNYWYVITIEQNGQNLVPQVITAYKVKGTFDFHLGVILSSCRFY